MAAVLGNEHPARMKIISNLLALALTTAASWSSAQPCRPIEELPRDEAAVAAVSGRHPSFERVRERFACFAIRSGSVVLVERDGTEHYFSYGGPDRGAALNSAGTQQDEEAEKKPEGMPGKRDSPPKELIASRDEDEGPTEEPIRDPQLADLARRLSEVVSPACETYLDATDRTWRRSRFPRLDRSVAPGSVSLRNMLLRREAQSVLSVTAISRCELAHWGADVAAAGRGNWRSQLAEIGRKAATLEYVMTALAGRVAALTPCPADGPGGCRETPVYALEPLRSAAQQAFQSLAGQASRVTAQAAEVQDQARTRDQSNKLTDMVTAIGDQLNR